MKQAACVLLSLLLWACEPASLPAPSIVSVAPERVPAGQPSSLSVRVNAALPIVVDYQEQGVDPAQLGMKVRLGGQEVDIPFAEPDGTLIVPVPEGLSVGAYDIQVTLADGREALRENAFQVLPAPALHGGPGGGDGGTGGDGGADSTDPFEEIGGGIIGFYIDPIRDQVRQRPFEITVRAVGPDAWIYSEPVRVRANRGAVETLSRGAFAKGVRVEKISVNHVGSVVYLLVEDSRGRKGLSNPFRVHPH
jgi:hypothetical protein